MVAILSGPNVLNKTKKVPECNKIFQLQQGYL